MKRRPLIVDHASPIPSLNGLRAFEVAARRLSFSEAAQEFHVTPAAISQQIRQLEQQIGQPLFERTTRALVLTPQGLDIYPLIEQGFDRFYEARARLHNFGFCQKPHPVACIS